MKETQTLEVGTLLANRYQVTHFIGSGGMGQVYRAIDSNTNSACAVKIVKKDSAFGYHAFVRMKQEAEITAQLFHPNIVEIFDTNQTDAGVFFIVMELLRGKDLQTLIHRQSRLTLTRTLEIIRPIVSALYAAHSVGIIHRDIKPSNIFLAHHGISDIETPKLLDFGLARRMSSQPHQKGLTNNLIVGTIEYLSPEATEPSQVHVDERSDQWSLAVLIFRMLSGNLPFEHPDPLVQCLRIRTREAPPLSRFVSGLPTHVTAAIERALQKDKQARFPSVVDFLRSLEGRISAPSEAKQSAGSSTNTDSLPTISDGADSLHQRITQQLSGWSHKSLWLGALGGVSLLVSISSLFSKSTEPRTQSTILSDPDETANMVPMERPIAQPEQTLKASAVVHLTESQERLNTLSDEKQYQGRNVKKHGFIKRPETIRRISSTHTQTSQIIKPSLGRIQIVD